METVVTKESAQAKRAIEQLPADLARHRMLGIREAAQFLGLSVSLFRRMSKEGDAPAGRWLSQNRLGWPVGELADWAKSRPQQTKAA